MTERLWQCSLIARLVLGSALAAGCAGCAGRNAPAPDGPREAAGETRYDQNGDPVRTEPDSTKPEPADGGGPISGKTLPRPPADSKGEIIRDADGSCYFYETIECEPQAPCKPPPPLAVSCEE